MLIYGFLPTYMWMAVLIGSVPSTILLADDSIPTSLSASFSALTAGPTCAVKESSIWIEMPENAMMLAWGFPGDVHTIGPSAGNHCHFASVSAFPICSIKATGSGSVCTEKTKPTPAKGFIASVIADCCNGDRLRAPYIFPRPIVLPPLVHSPRLLQREILPLLPKAERFPY